MKKRVSKNSGLTKGKKLSAATSSVGSTTRSGSLSLAKSTKSEKLSAEESLTASQQDYLEAVHRLLHPQDENSPRKAVRITDIAIALGTRLPTVTRTVARLTERGLFRHEPRQGVRLTMRGERLASAFVHRHEDLLRFFVLILGLDQETAERDTCQIEHGLSEMSAQRLHEFLEYVDRLTDDAKEPFFRFASRPARSERPFEALPDQKVSGWRG